MEESLQKTVNDIKQQGKEVVRQPWLEPLMRLGYAVRGLMYALIGLLAIGVILGQRSGRFADRKGAITAIAEQPYGQIVLILVVVGLIGYALWGLVRFIYNPDRKGKGLKDRITRVGYLVSAVSYAALAYPALRMLLRQPGASSGTETDAGQAAAAGLMGQPLGHWLVGAAGAVMLAIGIANFLIGVRQNFDMRFKAYELSPEQLRWANRLGRFGYGARGIVFGLMGWFLIQAALTDDPNRVVGLDGALRELAGQPYGLYMLGVVAAGLIAFGIYSILGSIWFRFKKA